MVSVLRYFDETRGWSLPAVIGANLTPISAPYVVSSSDNGTTLGLNNNAFFSLTFPDPSGFSGNFNVTVANLDGFASGRAKTIILTNGDTFFLYPGQSIIVYLQNGAWQTIGRGRFKITNAKTLNVDSSGSDSNDGFTTGSANAKATVQGAFYQIANDFDYFSSVSNIPLITVLLATNDVTGVHFGPEGLVGAVAGGAITLDGGGHSISNGADTDAAMHMFFGAVLYIQNLTIIPGINNGGLILEKGAKAFLKTGNTFGPSASGAGGGAQIVIMDSGALEVDTNYSISGGAGIHMWCHHNGTLRIPAAMTITFTANAAFTWFTIAQAGGVSDFTNATINLNTFTVTGKRWEADNLGLVVSNTGLPDTYFPGTVNGTTSGGGQGV